MATKPLGGKAYGSIGHLLGSRLGPGDHVVSAGQARIATLRVRDRHDRVIVTEKVDGSCTAVARVKGKIIALGRAGYTAQSSPFKQHWLFDQWVRTQSRRFDALAEGQRMIGEWLAQAHGIRYALGDDRQQPWVPFDVMEGPARLPHDEARRLFAAADLEGTKVLSDGPPLSVAAAEALLGEYGHHGALDPAEGVVWRVERNGDFDFLVKYVRAAKIDGAYLPELTGTDAVWNWSP